jgi:hypothetical protein
MPTCPFFAGLHKSLPSSTTASPIKSVPSESPTTTRSLRNTSATTVAEEAPKNNKRRQTRQAEADDDPEIFTTVESPPPTKRRKSTRASQAAPKDEEETTVDEEPVQPARKGRVASTERNRGVSRNFSSRRKSTAEPPASPANRRVTRSGLVLPAPEVIEVESDEDEPPVEEEAHKKKTPAKPKGNHRKTKSRIIAAEPEDEPPAEEEPPKATTPAKPRATRKGKGRAVAVPDEGSDDDVQIIEALPKEKTPANPKGRNRKTSTVNKVVAEPEPEPAVSRRVTRSSDQLSADLAASEEFIEVEDEPAPAPSKTKRGRQTKAKEDIEPAQTGRRTRQSNISQPPDEPEEEEEEAETAAKPAKAIIVPKRKRGSARTTRAASSMTQELPEIEEDESEPAPQKNKRKSVAAIEIPVSTPSVEEPEEEEEEEEEIVAPPRGKKAARGRARSSVLRNSSITLSPVQETAKPRRARTSKRDISAVYDDIPEAPSPAPKRKASNTRSIQRIPTPSEEEEEVSSSDVFEDSKSTFSDLDEIRSRKKSTSARPPVRRVNRRSKAAVSEEREMEDAPSTIYHSADDYQSSPRSPSQSSVMGRSKREMVDNARKELEKEIWQERVANGEVGLGGSSEDDEKENAAEEKGKKPTRTVRGKGGKGRSKVKRKGAQSKVGSNVVSAAEDDGESSVGESHALVVKAMASPMEVGPVVADQAGSDESSVEEVEVEMVNGHVTPVQSPRRRVLSWSPAKIEAVPAAVVPNGVLSVEEEEMTVDAWMKWVINDEVRRLQEECEKLVKNLEREGERARRLLEHLI